ncbi:MAG TPA: cache domain-containing protein, partial [Ardenticatenaceae bacterium]|nr:cache domain-containing protein [Ardenticatenaceae bacterium]
MMRSPLLDLHTLSARMIVSFVVVIVVTMLAIGVPTLWVVGGELERQGWARVDQAAGATDALYAARLRELQMLATLTAERPTLRRLLEQRDEAALPAYLEEIRTTAQLDLLALLDSAGALVAHAELPTGWDDGIPSPLIVVRAGATPGLIELGGGGASGLAIQAVAPVLDEDGTAIGTVVEGMLVDESFLSTLREETGVHHSLFQNGVRVATTLP